MKPMSTTDAQKPSPERNKEVSEGILLAEQYDLGDWRFVEGERAFHRSDSPQF